MKYIFLFLFFFCYIQTTTASPVDTCDTKKREDSLLSVRLDTDIKTNRQLLIALEKKYGRPMIDHLLEEHPYFLIPEGRVDDDAIQWIKEAIWEIDAPTNRYIPIFLYDKDPTAMNEYINFVLSSMYIYHAKSNLVFMNSDDKSVFFSYLEHNIKSIIIERSPNLSQKTIERLADNVITHYIKNESYSIGLRGLPFSKPIIVIEGHSAAGEDGIQIGKREYSSKDLVGFLMKMQIPNNSKIFMNSCFSGCDIKKFPLAISEIRTLFLSGKLFTIVKQENNLLTHFSNELASHYPAFKGSVSGYIGVVQTPFSRDVLGQNGKVYAKTLAIILKGTDGKLSIKLEDAEVTKNFN